MGLGNGLFGRTICSTNNVGRNDMIRIGSIKLNPDHTEQDLLRKVAKVLRISETDILGYEIRRQSIDARKKPSIQYVYTVDLRVSNEKKILQKAKRTGATVVQDTTYKFPDPGNTELSHRPVIIGCGPAGLFCAYILAEHGFCPVVYERGASVQERVEDIRQFWETGVLNTESNVQFGEGGAGTFSDGKLNTMVKDASGRNRKVLEIFVENGAPEDILYVNKPHIGTDVLITVIQNMRQRILAWGGEIHFHSKLVNFALENQKLSTLTLMQEGKMREVSTKIVVLAIGHSARDTFQMLYDNNLRMQAKPFAVGVRVEHPQTLINLSQYGAPAVDGLPNATYKVTANLENHRGVYSFCMCPGGYVVNASSEEGMLAVNGMSYRARDGRNANSAIIVTVTPDDFGSDHPLAGIAFQRDLERKAYELGGGAIPVQRFEDFCNNEPSKFFGEITPQQKGAYKLANVRSIFPKELGESIALGIKSFDRQIHGFANPDTILSGVESRTSSPVRIWRNEEKEIENTGIYPCGEGAGYAGGIMSAAMDGLKVAESIGKKFMLFRQR